jgi:2-keto-4-pentenoate hydratase/2-oxohepta-3-ene-1,7-dioic acid hydratase in catechol pathway
VPWFVSTPGAVPTIWTYGHRNPEGLAWNPLNGSLWASEHGPNSADEINIIERGHNYGWAVASKSGQANMQLSAPGMDDPIVYFTPTFAPAGISFYTGNRYPGWKNTSLFVGGLRGQALRRLEIQGNAVVTQEEIFNHRPACRTRQAGTFRSRHRRRAAWFASFRRDSCRILVSTQGDEDEMKLLRYGPSGREKPGLYDASGVIRDLSGIVDDIAGEVLLPVSLARLSGLDPASLPVVSGQPRLGPCVGGVGKMVCVALNYSDHAAEAGVPLPESPLIFMKATSSISGPNDDIVLPQGSMKTDWEVELGVIIGTPGKYIPEERALDHVAGYCVANDVSERDFQFAGLGQWTKGKSADTFGPIGPWLVTADEVDDWSKLDLWLEIDGRRFQQGSTSTLVFGVPFLVSYLSRHMSLQTGDVILTGTPPGVGLGQKPPVYLSPPGQEVRSGVQGFGEQRQRVQPAAL